MVTNRKIIIPRAGWRLADNQGMDERKAIRSWVRTWEKAAPQLEAIRRREIRDADNLKTLALLESAFNHGLRTAAPGGLQAWSKCASGWRS